VDRVCLSIDIIQYIIVKQYNFDYNNEEEKSEVLIVLSKEPKYFMLDLTKMEDRKCNGDF